MVGWSISAGDPPGRLGRIAVPMATTMNTPMANSTIVPPEGVSV
jgi:hypothetical protein